jgi:hypothetical protein
VILSWGNSATQRLFESGKSRFRGLDAGAALELLAALHAAERLGHISPLKSVGLHPLQGQPARAMGDHGQRAMADLLPLQGRPRI